MRPETSRSTLTQSPARPPRRRRWRSLLSEAWRFSLVGIANVAINFVVFNALALTLFPSAELKANVVATAFATTTSYLMNRGWTFRHRKTTRIRREYVLFIAFNIAGLAIELAVMGAAKYGLGLTGLLALNLAKLAGLGLGTVFRFWTYRTFVFHGRPAPAGEAVLTADPLPHDEDLALAGDLPVSAAPAPGPAAAASSHPRPIRAPATARSAGSRPVPTSRGELATAPIGSPPGS